jgi:hypothetical protein
VLDRIAGSVEKALEFQRNRLERLSDPRVFIRRQGGEQTIPVVLLRGGTLRADGA